MEDRQHTETGRQKIKVRIWAIVAYYVMAAIIAAIGVFIYITTL